MPRTAKSSRDYNRLYVGTTEAYKLYREARVNTTARFKELSKAIKDVTQAVKNLENARKKELVQRKAFHDWHTQIVQWENSHKYYYQWDSENNYKGEV